MGTNDAQISFVNATKVACSGDIRTLVDYENYDTVDTSKAKFGNLFYNCSQLTSSPELPATNLADNCYKSMFYRCTALTQAPELPATTLAGDCYCYMFEGCTSLTQAPELPATDLADNCYSYMFSRCNNLNYIKMMATDISATNCLNGWLNGVLSSTGTFVKSKDATWNVTGESGIPSGWTVVTE